MSASTAVARRIEQRSLRFGIGANAVMTLAGFSAHVLTGSTALLLDGLYFDVLVGSSLIASRVSQNVVQPPDRAWPYGYEGQEALYVLFRSLVLLGVIGFGVHSSTSSLIDWWHGVPLRTLDLEPVPFYTAGTTALCLFLAWRHQWDLHRTGRVSLLLLTEARNARIDALINSCHGAFSAGVSTAAGQASGPDGVNHRRAVGAVGQPGFAAGAVAGSTRRPVSSGRLCR